MYTKAEHLATHLQRQARQCVEDRHTCRVCIGCTGLRSLLGAVGLRPTFFQPVPRSAALRHGLRRERMENPLQSAPLVLATLSVSHHGPCIRLAPYHVNNILLGFTSTGPLELTTLTINSHFRSHKCEARPCANVLL